MLLLPLVAISASALVVLTLRWFDPPTSAFMLGSMLDGDPAGTSGSRKVDYRWRDLGQISPYAAVAVVAAEDQNFAHHNGFDFKAIREAMSHNATGKRVRGASTISQQVAKNLFLWRKRSYPRKLLEAWYTVLIEAFWPKERILEVYLNVAQFGSGIYGVEAAAQRFYSRPAARLNREQCAMLAAVLPNPLRFRARRPGRYLVGRQRWILAQMSDLGDRDYLAGLRANASQPVRGN
ncbi:MAG: monofunctional biosynthetic peptidoglycan transglycosylase [Steroidobacteraceae bacterium]